MIARRRLFKREQLSDDIVLYLGDCRDIVSTLPKFQLVVTDPPWDQAKGILGSDNPRGLFADVAPLISLARMVVVQLGCYSDPMFLAPLAGLLPFFHTCWLRYIPPSYNGRVLVDADVAYVYGQPPPSVEGQRVIPSMCLAPNREALETEFLRSHGRNRTSKTSAETTARLDHPMARRLTHVRWLVRVHSASNDTVLDPFMGSGTTGVACVQLGLPFVGVEAEPKFFDVACKRVARALAAPDLFAVKPKLKPKYLGLLQ